MSTKRRFVQITLDDTVVEEFNSFCRETRIFEEVKKKMIQRFAFNPLTEFNEIELEKRKESKSRHGNNYIYEILPDGNISENTVN